MPTGNVFNLADVLGSSLASADYDTNRLRTQQADRLRQIAANRIAQSEGLANTAAAQGTIHSGVHLQGQTDIAKNFDRQTANSDQKFSDSLISLARRRIRDETQFNVNSMLPR